MIRVNLLPGSKREAKGVPEGSQTWLLAIFAAVLLEIVILIFVYSSRDSDLKKVRDRNSQIEANITRIKDTLKDHPQIVSRLKELKDREEAIDKLQAARTGPTSAMMELSHILSTGRGPTMDPTKVERLKKDSPQSLPNASWDSRRLWLTQYNEIERNVRIVGLARDGEDVSEFARRITVSDYFSDVKLLPGSKTIDSVTKLEVVSFQLSAKAKY